MTGPIAFREIVLKVHSRCDLACDHCYVYEHADQSWRARPKVISEEVIFRAASRLAEHARAHSLPSVTVILHGGEPLLAGPARLRLVCEEFTRALDGVAALDLRIHTNGLQLSSRFLDLFVEYGVKVGISLDGDRAANDRHRRFEDGRSSHPQVLRAVDLLREERYRHLYLGLLCTVDVANDPLAVHDALTALAPPRIDYLLPHATWQTPPARPDGSGTRSPYADWLLRIFDRWDQQGRPVPVRIFASVLSTLAGGPSLTESLGLAPTDLVVVETDGTLEQVDSLKSAYEGAAATGFDVFSHSFDQVAAHPGVRARQLGLAGVSKECRGCPVVRSCGGGLYTHRYKPESGFDNPSVYCPDLKTLIEGIEARTACTATAAAMSGPAEPAASQQELTRTLLARLHHDLDGSRSGGEGWDRTWALLSEIEQSSDALEPVLDHPYTRSWLLGALGAVREGRSCEADPAGQLAAVAAAAVVTGELDLSVRVPYVDGRLGLPTLGRLRLAAPGERGWAEVRATGAGGFLVRSGRQEWRSGEPGEEAAQWQPVRRLVAEGAPDLALDDVDPYRDCFSTPLHQRLGARQAADWEAKLARAWALLAAAVPDLAREAAAGLTTLTPLDKEEPNGRGSVGRHGPGALGIAVSYSADATAFALLTGWRRARLRALTEVADLYALDGEWLHEVPWRERPVPVSRLLADVDERVAVAAYRAAGAEVPAGRRGSLDDTRRAMERLGRAAELTSSGRSLLSGLWSELEMTAHG